MILFFISSVPIIATNAARKTKTECARKTKTEWIHLYLQTMNKLYMLSQRVTLTLLKGKVTAPYSHYIIWLSYIGVTYVLTLYPIGC